MAESAAGGDKLDLDIVLAPTLGRELFSDFPLRTLRPGYKADIDRIRLPIEVSRNELLASTLRGNDVGRHRLPNALSRHGIILSAIALAALTSACGVEDPVSRSIAAFVARGPGTRLVLTEHTTFGWDKVCIVGPYTPDDKVDSLTGIHGVAAQAHDIRHSDRINVLMFISEGRVAASVAHPRNEGDFGPDVVSKCYSREQAHFSVRVPPAGSWGTIGPE